MIQGLHVPLDRSRVQGVGYRQPNVCFQAVTGSALASRAMRREVSMVAAMGTVVVKSSLHSRRI